MVPRKVLHLGANDGQEVPAYDKAGIAAYHVEAIPQVFETLREACRPYRHQTPILACLDAESGRAVEFNVASNGGQSSSILDLGRHSASYPHIVVTEKIRLQTRTIDSLLESGDIPPDIDFALLDLQGAEDRALQGADSLLKLESLWGLWIEVAVEPLYEGGTDFLSLQERLQPYGFYLSGVQFNAKGWSDALFMKRWWPRSPDETTPLEAHRARYRPDLAHGINIGPEGVCTQSSLSRWSRADDPSRAVSVPLTGSYSFHTGEDDSPWWQVDFGSPRRFDRIVCFNRTNASSERADGLIIETSDDAGTWSVLHRNTESFGGILSGVPPLDVVCPDSRARLIRLRLPERGTLHLDGVRILDAGRRA